MRKLYIVFNVLNLEAKRTFKKKKEAIEYAEDQVSGDGEARYIAKVLWLVEQSVVHIRSTELEEEEEDNVQEEPRSQAEEA